MEKEFELLSRMSLFENIKAQDIDIILKCLNAVKKQYEKDEVISLTGGNVENIGIVLSGTVQVLKEDMTGRQTIISNFGAGETFAEVIVCAGIKKSPVTVLAATRVMIYFLNYSKIIQTCTSACVFHTQLIQNMLKVLAQKNLVMNVKISYLLIKGMRQKLSVYLINQYHLFGKSQFEIPFSRNELADYLSVDRSAMSRELSRMKVDSLISFHKNSFTLLDIKALVDLIS